MLTYYKFDNYEQISVKFESKYKYFLWRKCIWKYLLQNGSHFILASIETVSPEGTFCDTVQVPSSAEDMELN